MLKKSRVLDAGEIISKYERNLLKN
jgi:hypothetical protein